jgi:hypothetical protein
MTRPFPFIFLAVLCFAAASCGGIRKPSVEDATQAIKDYYSAQGRTVRDVKIIRFGESGKGDFSAPGSQDVYWPVEFDLGSEEVAKLGPIQISTPKDKGVAQIYKSKMGPWKVARLER